MGDGLKRAFAAAKKTRERGPIACRDLTCDGSCGLLSIRHYGEAAASKPLPTKHECWKFAAANNLDADLVVACCRISRRKPPTRRVG